MNIRQIRRASMLAVGALLAASAHADTTYDITFTAASASPTFSNPTGTFTIDSSDKITSFNVSFTVLKAYSFELASGSPGDVITFNKITAVAPGPVATYNPATDFFGSTYNNSLSLNEESTADPNNGATLSVDGGQNVLGRAFDIDALSQGTFTSGPLDPGTWSVTRAPVTGTPEPTSAALLLVGLTTSGVLLRRRAKFKTE